MKYLLFGGTGDTGKTESIHKLAIHLTSHKGFRVDDGHLPLQLDDFQCIIKKGERKILMHSYTDLPSCIWDLQAFLEKQNDVEIVITAIRDIVDPMRQRLIDELKIDMKDVFELPLGKVRRGPNRAACITWYLERIEKVAINMLSTQPFNII